MADATNTRIICLLVEILDPSQILDAVNGQIEKLKKDINFQFSGSCICSIVTEGDGSDYQQRKGIAYVFCTDQRLVWAFNGLTLDGKPLIRKEVKKIPIETVDNDKVKALTQIPTETVNNDKVKVLTQSSDSKSSPPPSVCASDGDTHIVVGVSKSSSWADDVEDDDFFNKPLVFSDTTASNVEKVRMPKPAAVAKASPSFREVVEQINDKPLITTFTCALNQKQIDFYKNCNQNRDTITIEPTARSINANFDHDKHSYFTLATSRVDDDITEFDVKSYLQSFVSDKSKKITIVKIGGQTYRNQTYPIVYTRYAGKDNNKRRVILAQFDPNTKDAEYALYICRQTRFYKNNKELKAYFVNAWQSMC